MLSGLIVLGAIATLAASARAQDMLPVITIADQPTPAEKPTPAAEPTLAAEREAERQRALEKSAISESTARIRMRVDITRDFGDMPGRDRGWAFFADVYYAITFPLPETKADHVMLHIEKKAQRTTQPVYRNIYRETQHDQLPVTFRYSASTRQFLRATEFGGKMPSERAQQIWARREAQRTLDVLSRQLTIRTWSEEQGVATLEIEWPEAIELDSYNSIRRMEAVGTIVREEDHNPKALAAMYENVLGPGLSELAVTHRDSPQAVARWAIEGLPWSGSDIGRPWVRDYIIDGSGLSFPLPFPSDGTMPLIVEVLEPDSTLKWAKAFHSAPRGLFITGPSAPRHSISRPSDDDHARARGEQLRRVQDLVHIHVLTDDGGVMRVAFGLPDPRFPENRAMGYLRLEHSDRYPTVSSFWEGVTRIERREERLRIERARSGNRVAGSSAQSVDFRVWNENDVRANDRRDNAGMFEQIIIDSKR